MSETADESGNQVERFESADGSHAVEVDIPEDRRHHTGLMDKLEEWDSDD